MQKVKVYVSIPITGHNQLKQRAHVLEVIDKLDGYFTRTKPGFMFQFINPFEIGDALERMHHAAGIDPPNHGDYMSIDLKAVVGSDLVYMCKGWENSTGCQMEHNTGLHKGKQIMYENNS